MNIEKVKVDLKVIAADTDRMQRSFMKQRPKKSIKK